jgi:tRNA(Ile)-lysidine synthase
VQLLNPPIDKNVLVACSGGVDSVVLAKKLSKNNNITLAHYSHHDDWIAESERETVRKLAELLNVNFVFGYSTTEPNTKLSKEEGWRTERYSFLLRTASALNFNIISTGHTLEDAVEWHLMSSFRGESKLLPAIRINGFISIVRPLLIVNKPEIEAYAKKKQLPYIVDQNNFNPDFCDRNRVRNKILPEINKIVNLYSVIRNKYLKLYNSQ